RRHTRWPRDWSSDVCSSDLVHRGFLYSIPLRKAEPVVITQHLRRKVIQTVMQIRHIVESEIIPSPPNSLSRCVTCEFRRFCNDEIGRASCRERGEVLEGGGT